MDDSEEKHKLQSDYEDNTHYPKIWQKVSLESLCLM